MDIGQSKIQIIYIHLYPSIYIYMYICIYIYIYLCIYISLVFQFLHWFFSLTRPVHTGPFVEPNPVDPPVSRLRRALWYPLAVPVSRYPNWKLKIGSHGSHGSHGSQMKSDEVSMFSMDQWKYELFGPLSFQIFHFDAKESQRLCQCLHLQLNKGNNKSVQHRTSDPSLGLCDEDDGSSSWAAAVASWIPRELHQVLP
jgi:hypothetical protein